LTISPDPLEGKPDTEYTLTAETKGRAPQDAKYEWDFGDGTSKVIIQGDSIAKHTYTQEGSFTISLVVKDGKNNLLGSKTSLAEIKKESAIVAFDYKKSGWDGLYGIDFGLMIKFNFVGTLESLGQTQIAKIDTIPSRYLRITMKVTHDIPFSSGDRFRFKYDCIVNYELDSYKDIHPNGYYEVYTMTHAETYHYRKSWGEKIPGLAGDLVCTYGELINQWSFHLVYYWDRSDYDPEGALLDIVKDQKYVHLVQIIFE
jgi:hypothetical protein